MSQLLSPDQLAKIESISQQYQYKNPGTAKIIFMLLDHIKALGTPAAQQKAPGRMTEGIQIAINTIQSMDAQIVALQEIASLRAADWVDTPAGVQ